MVFCWAGDQQFKDKTFVTWSRCVLSPSCFLLGGRSAIQGQDLCHLIKMCIVAILFFVGREISNSRTRPLSLGQDVYCRHLVFVGWEISNSRTKALSLEQDVYCRHLVFY